MCSSIFVHVYVDATTRKSVPVPEVIRAAVAPLVAGPAWVVTPAQRAPDAKDG